MEIRHKYEMIVADILNRIRSGEWPTGTKIPSVNELVAVYPYSYLTIHKALQNLINQGYLRTQRGVGTFVARDRPDVCVGLIVSEDILHPQTTPWPAMLLQGLRDFFTPRDSAVKVYIEGPPGNGEIPVEGLEDDLRRHVVSGIVLANCNASRYLPNSELWRRSSVPLVDITGWTDAPHRITFDREALIDLALRHVRDHARRRVAGIRFDNSRDSFVAKTGELGLETRPEWLLPPSEGDVEHSGFIDMMRLWRRDPKPDALVIGDDVAAKGVLQAVGMLGLSVPDDLFIVSSANRGSGIFYPVSVDLIEYNIGECAREAGNLLLDLIRDSTLPPRTVMLRPRLATET